MPKTIEYPRTNYLGAWEVAEVVDDTGGKCSIDACARKLNRKVSGSFKAILGSAVKFGLLTSKREMLTTTNLFRRIKNAYDKEEEKIYHREAFLHPPLFSHICRKFRNRELPVHMLDVMLVREFNVEEINAQNVAKAFVEGARMVDIIDERNIIADIDQLAKASPRRELASPGMSVNMFKPDATADAIIEKLTAEPAGKVSPVAAPPITTPDFSDDAVASLFGFGGTPPTGISTPASFVPKQAETRLAHNINTEQLPNGAQDYVPAQPASLPPTPTVVPPVASATPIAKEPALVYTVRISGPGVDTQLAVLEETDLLIVQALLEKVRKHLQRGE